MSSQYGELRPLAVEIGLPLDLSADAETSQHTFLHFGKRRHKSFRGGEI